MNRGNLCVSILGLLILFPMMAPAQSPAQNPRSAVGPAVRDEPTAYSELKIPPEEEPTGFKKAAQAVCWYLPNRVADLFDIPRIYFTLGDGMGASVRATKFLEATWYQDEAYILGWSPRHAPFAGEQIEERYLGFLAAQKGRKVRDKTEVGLSLHFIAVGVNIAGSLSEAADFVLGFVGVDLAGDDHGPSYIDKTKDEMTDDGIRSAEEPTEPKRTEREGAESAEPATVKTAAGEVMMPVQP